MTRTYRGAEPKDSMMRRASAVRLALAALVIGALGGLSACERVDQAVQKVRQYAEQHGVINPPPPSNPNPAPAPAPDESGSVVTAPGETPPAETPPADSGVQTPPAQTTPDAPSGAPAPVNPSAPAAPAPSDEQPGQPESPAAPPVAPEPAPSSPPVVEPTPPASEPGAAAALFKDAGKFMYNAVGVLTAGSGAGVKDETIYAPGIAFPIKDAPTFLNSQVYGVGGMSGPAGSECSAVNYSYPWQDNFCEKRSGVSRASYNCPSKAIHQGQDIRAGDSAFCTKIKKIPQAERHGVEVVAVEDGIIQYIGAYTVDLRAGGRIYRYLHMNMKALKVERNQSVKKGQLIGYLSNDFGVDANGKPAATTLHLHFEIKQNIDGVGWTWVSPYMSLVEAYKRDHPDTALISSVPAK